MRLRLGRCELRISFWFLMLVAAAAYLGGDIALLPAAAALHEGGHVAAILLCGGCVERLELGLFGAYIRPHFGTIGSLGQELTVLLCGPAAGAAAGLMCVALGARQFGLVNLGLSAVNLLPVEGLDGGSILRALLVDRLGGARGEAVFGRVSLTALLCLLGAGTAVFRGTSPLPAVLLAGSYLLFAGQMRR